VAKLRGPERLARLLAGAIEDPRELRPDVSEPVARVVMRCLRADPKVRWPSVAHLRTALHDAFPDPTREVPRAEVTRTDVTRAVPVELMKERAAQAFGSAGEGRGEPGAPSSVPPATRRATPLALHGNQTGAADFEEMATEVRAPVFTPASLVDPALAPTSSPPSPAPPPTQPLLKTLASKPHASTLRSAAAGAKVDALLADLPPHEKTRPMPGAPQRPVLPTVTDAAAQPPAATAGRPPAASTPAVPARRRLAPRVIVLIAAGGVLSLAALGVIGWLVASLLAGSGH
jgi:hypothetical protein